MNVKIEHHETHKLPRNTDLLLQKALKSVPREHLRGIDRVRLVDSIIDPRQKVLSAQPLPGLYHPKQPGQPSAWIEIGVGTLLPGKIPFHKKFFYRLSFKNNLLAILFSLIAQHHYLNFRHSVKRGNIESNVRSYTEKHLKSFFAADPSLRARLFKPLQPRLEKWARALQKKKQQNK